MADKQPRRPVKKPLVSTKLLLLTQHDNGKGKYIEIIYFPVRFSIKTSPPAAVGNQIAGKARIPPAHERKKK